MSKNPDNIQTVDAARHGKLRLKPNPAFDHAKTQHAAGINLTELAQCASCFPVAFIKQPNGERYLLVALLGLRAGENIYYGPQWWESSAVPLGIQRHPFVAGYDDRVAEATRVTTCIDVSSPFVGSEGEPLFNDKGEESELLKRVHDMLGTMWEAQRLTDRFVQAVTDLGLIVPIELELVMQNNTSNKATGLYTLDETKLGKLESEQILDLHRQGFLAPCYLIMASLHQLRNMIRLRNRKGGEQIINFRIGGLALTN